MKEFIENIQLAKEAYSRIEGFLTAEQAKTLFTQVLLLAMGRAEGEASIRIRQDQYQSKKHDLALIVLLEDEELVTQFNTIFAQLGHNKAQPTLDTMLNMVFSTPEQGNIKIRIKAYFGGSSPHTITRQMLLDFESHKEQLKQEFTPASDAPAVRQ